MHASCKGVMALGPHPNPTLCVISSTRWLRSSTLHELHLVAGGRGLDREQLHVEIYSKRS